MREELSHYCKPLSRADALQHPQTETNGPVRPCNVCLMTL